jgi:glycosyltransferase involved in cell wall biosynthesis
LGHIGGVIHNFLPDVDVIIPTYNRAYLLSVAIKSVLKQTFTNFDLIIVDDASTDETLQVVQRFNDKRIKYIRHNHNKGGSAARNTGLDASRSEYIAFLDSDDEWLPNKLQKQMDLFRKSNDQIGLIYTWLAHIYEDGQIKYSKPRIENAYKKLLVNNFVGSSSSGVIKRDVLSFANGFDESLPARQDMDFWVRIAEHFELNCVPEVLVKIYHRQSGERISCNKDKQLVARDLFYQKHKDRMLKAGVAHLHLCKIGQFCREHFDDISKVRRYFFEAIRLRPKSCLPYLYLMSTFLPRSVVKTLRSVKQGNDLYLRMV